MKGCWTNLGWMPYAPCHALQDQLLERIVLGEEPSTLLVVEHPPVLSLGASFHRANLLFPEEFYRQQGIEVIPTDRGGDVTFHGPNQLVAYPIFNLKDFGQDLHRWLRDLEETVIRTAAAFGLEGYRFPPHTGVWIAGAKVCAIGIKVRRWVSKHGIALNCNNDLAPFGLIVPCGIVGYGVTSLSEEAGRELVMDEVRPVLVKSFEEVFGIELAEQNREALLSRLDFDPWIDARQEERSG